ncbi:MAG: glycosyltransferase family 4 protein [Deltaproteobacteria bacterium]|nr:glycosyltransferase family 4 protein [Deltaproteobacteria bacterium]
MRVLHTIDGLAGGGAERLLWDLVRGSEPSSVVHHVAVYDPSTANDVYGAMLLRAGTQVSRPDPHRGLRHFLDRVVGRLATTALSGRVPPYLRERLANAADFLVSQRSRAVAKALHAVAEFRPQLIHAHVNRGFDLGREVAAVTGLPLVHTVPALIEQMVDAGWHRQVAWYRTRHEQAHAFFTAYPDELLSLGVAAAKVHELTGVLDIHRIEAFCAERLNHRKRVRAELGIPEDAPVLLSVGRLWEEKGHGFAAAAFGRLRKHRGDAHWILCGVGPERERIERTLADAGATGAAHLVGFVPEPLPYYAAADIYLRTMLLEGENLSSYQAIAMGLPVVGFDTKRSTELIRRVGHGVLVPVGEALALAAAVDELLVDPARRSEMGRLGADFAARALDIQHTVDVVTSVYQRVVRDEGPRVRPRA